MILYKTYYLRVIIMCISLIFICNNLCFSQEDCATATPIVLSTTFNGNNSGALPDLEYSAVTGCPSADFAASFWYSFTLPSTVSSVNITFTAGTIGSNSTFTLVDDCNSNVSYSFIWSSCDLTSISGNTVTHCSLIPGQTYYIQIASLVSDVGSFTINVSPNPSSPINDICANAIEVFGGIIECNEFELMPAFAGACPDPEATGNCVQSTDPGVWYTFQTGNPLEYSAVLANPVGHNFEMFSSASGDCSSLVFEFCSGSAYVHDLEPSTTYFVLVESDLLLQPFLSADQTTCNTPLVVLDNGNGSGGVDLGMNSCVPGDPVMPCQNDNIVWYSYTVGCVQADITISIEQWNVGGPLATMTDGGIMAINTDCGTILSNFDPNGLGYICSGIIGNEKLILTNMPPGYQFLIAIGSDNPLSGYYEVTVEENSAVGGNGSDLCADAVVLTQTNTLNLSNICSTQDFTTPPCSNLSEATVWFTYDPAPNIEDITINLNPLTIGSTVIAAYSDCAGSLIDLECGNSLILNCVNSPIYIQIGSDNANEGTFDLEVQTSVSQPPPDIEYTFMPICSGDNLNIQLNIPGGLIGDINVVVSSNNSSDLSGMMAHNFTGVSSAVITDAIINCSSTTETVFYEVSVTLPGYNCPGPSLIIEGPVYPKFNVQPLDIEGCLDYEIDINIDEIITGGSSPYQSISWLWDGITPIGSGVDITNYEVTSSGYIQVDVVDVNQCETSANINVVGNSVEVVTFIIDKDDVCQGSSSTININAEFINNGVVTGSSWVVTDENNNPVDVGTMLLLDYYFIDVDYELSGTYTITCTLFDDNGCESLPITSQFTIKPNPKGVIEIKSTGQCGIVLSVQFYDDSGSDIYNNGPDSNFDGIPDIFDLDNDGYLDYSSITWRSPSSGDYITDELSFVPIEEGIYEVILAMNNGCTSKLLSEDVQLPLDVRPTISGTSNICDSMLVSLIVEPDTYIFYTWTDSNGDMYSSNSFTLEVSPSNSTDYYVNVFDNFGCEFIDTFSLTVHQDPVINLTGSTTLCPGEVSIIDAGLLDTTWTYIWVDSTNNIISSDTSFYSFSESGKYQVIVNSLYGCTDTMSFEITEDEDINVEIIGNDICGNTTASLTAGIGFDFYEWSNGSGDIIGDMPDLSITEPGLYILSTGIGACNGSDSININQYEPPFVDIIPIIEICNNTDNALDTLVDFNVLSQNSDSGIWSSVDFPLIDLSNLDAVSFGAIPAGIYRFVYTSNNAIVPCTNVADTMQIIVKDCSCPLIETLDDMLVCNIDYEFDLDDFLQAGTSNGYWTFITGPINIDLIDNAFNTLNLNTGSYSFEYRLSEIPPMHCDNIDTVTVIIQSSPIIEIVQQVTVCNAKSNTGPHILNLSDQLINGSGDWINPNITGLNFSDITNLDFTGINPGAYFLSILSNDAKVPCTNINDSIQIIVLDCNCPILNLMNGDVLCSDLALLYLSNFEGLSEPGIWSASEDNPEIIQVSNSKVVLTDKFAGIYEFIYTLTNPNPSCKSIDTISFTLFEPPIIFSSIDTIACNVDLGDNENIINLFDLIETDDDGIWFDNNGDIVLNPVFVDFVGELVGSVINYSYVTTTAEFPCENVEIHVSVEIKECSCIDPIFLDPPNLCNHFNQELNLQDLIISNHIGTWSILESPDGDTDMLKDSVFRYQDIVPGSYLVEFSISEVISDQCQQNWELDIMVFSQDSAEISTSPIICTSGEIQETQFNLYDAIINGNQDGYWIDEDFNLITNTLLTFLDQDTGYYNYGYIVENSLPCENITYEFSIKAIGCEIEIKDDIIITVPSVFSPDGNGVNDWFYPISTIDLEIQSFFVFDRWGNKVFSSKGSFSNVPENGWDGKFNGNYVASGVYVYVLNILDINGESLLITGDVTVLK